MGWSGGTAIFSNIITTLQFHIKDDEVRKELYQDMLDAFEDADWDTQDECLGIDIAYDEVYHLKYPGDFDIDLEDEDDENNI
jgi:hypothetical protein